MKQEHLSVEARIEEIHRILSLLQSELSRLGSSTSQVLLSVQQMEKKKSSEDRDDLTGLLRRNAFTAAWRELASREPEHCLLVLDIDHFKKINDTYGHVAGDRALQAVAQLLRSAESQGCVVGRLGGEEFVIVMPGGIDSACAYAEELREGISKLQILIEGSLTQTGPIVLSLTVSVGVALSSVSPRGCDANETVDTLQRADRALYSAKRHGRNQVRVAIVEENETMEVA